MERTIHTSYNHDFQRRPNNRQLAVQRKTELHRPDGGCFIPATAPVSVTLNGGTPEKHEKHEFEEEVRRKNWQRCGANRFVKGLARTHPELYWELTEGKNRAWQERAGGGGSPLKSSYQLDYDRLPECAPCPVSPVPPSCDDDPTETSRWPDWKYFQRECNGVPVCRAMTASSDGKIGLCSCQLCPSPSSKQWQRVVCCSKPSPRYGRVEAISNIPKSFITSGHWPEPDWQTAVRHSTEYRREVGRMGGIVQRANIHNHSRCTPQRNCRHRFFI